MLERFALYFHTVRYLKPVQIWGRIWYRLFRVVLNDEPVPDVRVVAGEWTCRSERPATMLSAERFRFLNQESDVLNADAWQRSDMPMLWWYNLHYFDDLSAHGADQRVEWHELLINRWVAEIPLTEGVGWQPYPISLRSVNWIKWQLKGNTLSDSAVTSLALQVRFLRSHLEIHLLGNHLWANAKALVFAGCFFEGEEADEWLKKGLSLIQRESAEQILDDGGHFELSPMYHAIVLEDLLDLVQLAMLYPQRLSQAFRDEWTRLTKSMFVWLSAMSHPDGGISFFNDATHGIAPDLAALTRYAEVLGILVYTPEFQPQLLSESGYLCAQNAVACLIADVGCIGPDYLPGHAHADTLSFELSLFGQRVIVNQGIDRYGTDPERVRQRGTAAHSTVEVDGENSSEVWSGFRVARRAYPQQLSFEENGPSIFLNCAHDGYRRLPGRVAHQRTWALTDQSLIVTDKLSGKYQAAVAYFHLHPAVRVSSVQGNSCVLNVDEHEVTLTVTGGHLNVGAGAYHEGFGLRAAAACLQVSMTADQLSTELSTEIRWDASERNAPTSPESRCR